MIVFTTTSIWFEIQVCSPNLLPEGIWKLALHLWCMETSKNWSMQPWMHFRQLKFLYKSSFCTYASDSILLNICVKRYCNIVTCIEYWKILPLNCCKSILGKQEDKNIEDKNLSSFSTKCAKIHNFVFIKLKFITYSFSAWFLILLFFSVLNYSWVSLKLDSLLSRNFLLIQIWIQCIST